MKLAREPAFSRPKPCASLKKPHESCPFAAPCGPRRKKITVVRDQLFPQKPPGSRFRFSRTGVQPSPGSSTIELPSAFAESGAQSEHLGPSLRPFLTRIFCQEIFGAGGVKQFHWKNSSGAQSEHLGPSLTIQEFFSRKYSWFYMQRIS